MGRWDLEPRIPHIKLRNIDQPSPKSDEGVELICLPRLPSVALGRKMVNLPKGLNQVWPDLYSIWCGVDQIRVASTKSVLTKSGRALTKSAPVLTKVGMASPK